MRSKEGVKQSVISGPNWWERTGGHMVGASVAEFTHVHTVLLASGGPAVSALLWASGQRLCPCHVGPLMRKSHMDQGPLLGSRARKHTHRQYRGRQHTHPRNKGLHINRCRWGRIDGHEAKRASWGHRERTSCHGRHEGSSRRDTCTHTHTQKTLQGWAAQTPPC